MTFGVSRDQGLFEWSGTATGIFAQRKNLFSPRMWRMIFDIVRFNQFALDLLGKDVTQANGHANVENSGKAGKGSEADEQTIGEYLEQEGYSRAFIDDYLIPMTAAVWSTSPDKASLDFPAITLVRFMWNHHLLSTIAARPTWLTIPGGSQRYIDAILSRADASKFRVYPGCAVTSVSRPTEIGKSLDLTFHHPGLQSEQTQQFDHVIFACHGDEVLPILSASKTVSSEERSVLEAFQTTPNRAYLHSDLSLMPKRRAVWTAWNYLTSSAPSKLDHPAGVSLTYWMNDLQPIPEEKFGPVLVTMNPPHPPAPELTQGEYQYRHPLYTTKAVRAQQKLEYIQNTSGISYCGAWTKYGFHEDGFSSGLKVAIDHLGAKIPFDFVDSTYSRGKAPALDLRDHIVRTIVSMIQRILALLDILISLPPVAAALNVLDSLVLGTSSRRKVE